MSETTKKKNSKNTKVLDRVLNIITIIIAVIVLAVAISTITSAGKGYNAMFGKAGISVLTESMEGKEKDSFKKGDLIYIDVLKAEEKSALKTGDVITFYDNIKGVKALNTHRIIEIINYENQEIQYVTKGDNNPAMDSQSVAASEVVGKYTGTRLAGIGAMMTFIKGPTGFAIFVVVPAFLIVAYAIFMVIRNFKVVNKEKMELAREQGAMAASQTKEEMEQQIRQELLQQMKDEQGITADTAATDNESDKPVE